MENSTEKSLKQTVISIPEPIFLTRKLTCGDKIIYGFIFTQKMDEILNDQNGIEYLREPLTLIPLAIAASNKLSDLDKVVFGVIFTKELYREFDTLNVNGIYDRTKFKSKSKVVNSLKKLKTLELTSERKVRLGEVVIDSIHPLYPDWLLEEWTKHPSYEKITTDSQDFKLNRQIKPEEIHFEK